MSLQGFRQARPHLAAGAITAIAAAVVACGGNAPAKPLASASPTSPPGSPMPTAGAAAQLAAKSVWEEFFNARTPTSRRIVLLQNGQTFARVLAAQASMPMATSVTARVSRVMLASPNQAKVIYTILLTGKPVLSDQTGVAVYQDGTWKVAVASFCGLLVMESGGSSSSLPAACRSSG